MIRNTAVAGQFYPAKPESLKSDIFGFTGSQKSEEDAIAVISPHAGYMYSGAVAGAVFSSVKIKDTVIALGPNHTGLGAQFSIMAKGAWHTPLGDVPIEEKLAAAILDNSDFLKEDTKAHMYEHSIEVQLPFLKYMNDGLKFVPIILGDAPVKTYEKIGKEIAGVIKKYKGGALLVASSDMTHYESKEEAENKDKKAIDSILKLDAEGLMDKIKKFNISMCGYAPVCAVIYAAKELGAKTAKLIKYQTSGDVSGDYSKVVGYAGVAIYG